MKKPLLAEVVYDAEEVMQAADLMQAYPQSNAHWKHLHAFEVLCIKHAPFASDTGWETIRLLTMKGGRSRFSLGLWASLRLRIENPAIVLVHGMHSPQRMILLKCLLRKTPLVVQHHGEIPYRGARALLQKLADRWIDAYFFHSTALAKPFVDAGMIGKQKDIFEIPEAAVTLEAVNKEQARAILGIPMQQKILLSVGRLIPSKDITRVLNAFAGADEDLHLYLLYTQNDLENSLMEMTKQASCRSRIHWIGKVDKAKMNVWYSASDVFVSASLHEGSGYALMEALACGCFPLLNRIPAFEATLGKSNRVIWMESNHEGAQMNLAIQNAMRETPADVPDFSGRSLAKKWTEALLKIMDKKFS